MMKRGGLMVGALVLLLAACSSDDEAMSAKAVLPGNWVVSAVRLNGTDMTATLYSLGRITRLDGSFTTGGSFSLSGVGTDTTRTSSGTYTVDEEDMTLTLTASTFSAPVVMNYRVDSETRVTLASNNAALLAELSGVDPSLLGGSIRTVDIDLTRKQ